MASINEHSSQETYIEIFATEQWYQCRGITIPANTLGVVLRDGNGWSLIPLPPDDDSARKLSVEEVHLLHKFVTNRTALSQQLRRIHATERRDAWIARAASTLCKNFPDVNWARQLTDLTSNGPPPMSRRRLARLANPSHEDDIAVTSDHYASANTSGESAEPSQSLTKSPRKRRRGGHPTPPLGDQVECRCRICRRGPAVQDELQWRDVLQGRAIERSRVEAAIAAQLEEGDNFDGEEVQQDRAYAEDEDSKDAEVADDSKSKVPLYPTALLSKTLQSRDVALGQPLAGVSRMFVRTLRAVQREQGLSTHGLHTTTPSHPASRPKNLAASTVPKDLADHRPEAATRGELAWKAPATGNKRFGAVDERWRPRRITRRRFYGLGTSKSSARSRDSQGKTSRRARFSTLSQSPPPDAVYLKAPLPGRDRPVPDTRPIEFDDSSEGGNFWLFAERRVSSASSFTKHGRAPSARPEWREFFWKLGFGGEEDEPREFPRGGGGQEKSHRDGTSTEILDDEDSVAVASDVASYQSTVDWFAEQQRDPLVRAHEVAEDVLRAGGHRLRYQRDQFRHDHVLRDEVLDHVVRATDLVMACLDPLNVLTWDVRGRMLVPDSKPRLEDSAQPFRNPVTYRTMVSEDRTRQQGVDKRGIRGWRLNVEQATLEYYGLHNNSDRARVDDMLRTMRQIQERLDIVVKRINEDNFTLASDGEHLAIAVENVQQAEILLCAVQEDAYNGTYTGPCRFPGYELNNELVDDDASSVSVALSDSEADLDAEARCSSEEGEVPIYLEEEYVEDEGDIEDDDCTVQWEEVVAPLDEDHDDDDAHANDDQGDDFDVGHAGEELVHESTYDIDNASTTSTTGSSSRDGDGSDSADGGSHVHSGEGVWASYPDAHLDASLWDNLNSSEDASQISRSGSFFEDRAAGHFKAELPALDEVVLDNAVSVADYTTLPAREDSSSTESSSSSTGDTSSSSMSRGTHKNLPRNESWEFVSRADS